MIERAARAIDEALNDALSELRQNGAGPYPGDFLAAARAAIEAMREPTDAMIRAGDGPEMADAGTGECAWERMIDAALNPQPDTCMSVSIADWRSLYEGLAL